MDGTSKKILKFINKNSSVKNHCNIFYICEKLDLDYDVAKYYLNYLLSQNLIEYFDTSLDYKDWYYRSTPIGAVYFKNKIEQRFLAICNGIIFPIVVSLATNLILELTKLISE